MTRAAKELSNIKSYCMTNSHKLGMQLKVVPKRYLKVHKRKVSKKKQTTIDSVPDFVNGNFNFIHILISLIINK